MTPSSPAYTIAPIPVGEQCVLCRCRLTTPYLIARGLCGSCADRPEARTLPRDAEGRAQRIGPPRAQTRFSSARAPRPFTHADKALIQRVHGYLPLPELLAILNERLNADAPQCAPYTVEQLHAELRDAITPASTADWAGLRQVLSQARRLGLLAQISPQIVDDFAVVFSLSPAQVLRLKDVLAHAKEGR